MVEDAVNVAVEDAIIKDAIDVVVKDAIIRRDSVYRCKISPPLPRFSTYSPTEQTSEASQGS